MPSFDYIRTELTRKHMTLQLLWHEYKEKNPEGYEYSQFCLSTGRGRDPRRRPSPGLQGRREALRRLCRRYDPDPRPRDRSSHPRLSLCRHPWREQLYLRRSRPLQGASFLDQTPRPYLRVHGRRPEIVMPDNLKDRRDPSLPVRARSQSNVPGYGHALRHRGHPGEGEKAGTKPRWSRAVLIAERWIIAALRNHTFFSIRDLNRAIREKLEDFNTRPLQKLKVRGNTSSRRSTNPP